MSIDFALGFIAGEGTFTVRRSTSTKGGKTYIRPYFQLRVKENDKDSIQYAREVFDGIGTERHADGDMYNWRVENKDECLQLAEKIEDSCPDVWWNTEKGKNFRVWKEIVEIYADGRTDAEQRLEMAKIARGRLNNGAKNAKSDDDWDEIIEEFEEQSNRNG